MSLPRAISQEKANEELIGPFFVGIILNYLLWGIQIIQCYYYYISYRKTDRTWIKAAVGLIFVAEAVQSICVTEGVWKFVVSGWGNPDSPTELLSPGFNIMPLMGAVSASIVHFFYAQKIWTLLQYPYKHIFTAIVVILSCFQLTTGIGCTAFMFSIDITLATFYRLKTWAIAWLVPASMTDIAITSIMTWKLSSSRRGFNKRTDDIISKLILLVVETGLAPAIGQILDLIIYLTWPAMSYHVSLTLLEPKVYSISMLALLNSRKAQNITISFDSNQDRPVDGIQLRTTQTVVVHSDYDSFKLGGSSKSSAIPPDESISGV